MKTPEQDNIICTEHKWFRYEGDIYRGSFTCEVCGEDSFEDLEAVATLKPAPEIDSSRRINTY